MKINWTLGLLFSLVVISASGCESQEEFVTKESGLWNVTSYSVKTFHNDTQVSDITRTDSLGQMYFDMDGFGVKISHDAVRDTFIWSMAGEDKDRLVVYYKNDPWMNATIMDQSETSMTLFWENYAREDTTDVFTESTAVYSR